MRRRFLAAGLTALAALVLILLLRRATPRTAVAFPDALSGVAPHKARSVPHTGRPRRGGMDLTFLVTSDTHLGYSGKIPWPGHPEGLGVEDAHRIVIGEMNRLPGTPFPAPLGGAVGEPRGVLVAGDITETGQTSEWARFEAMYGFTGKEGLLRYPVFEGAGNHDVWGGPHVNAAIAKRHGAPRYSWDWDDLHFVCLGEAPEAADLVWLGEDLSRTGPGTGVVLFFHYPLEGPTARDNWFGGGGLPDALAGVLDGYDVIGIFSGHFHTSGPYRWRGYDAYVEGSVKHAWHSFSVVHVTDTRWTVASYNYDRRAFWWWHDKPIFGAAGADACWLSPTDPLVGKSPAPRP
jgi:hypothetical protein